MDKMRLTKGVAGSDILTVTLDEELQVMQEEEVTTIMPVAAVVVMEAWGAEEAMVGIKVDPKLRFP